MTLLAAGLGVLGGCPAHHAGALEGEPEGATFATLEAGGGSVRVRYLDLAAEGPTREPPALFLHGFGSSLDNWRPVMERLAEGRRVIGLDLKGFGWSERPEGDYSPRAQASLVLALMDRLGVSSAAIVAHSWGSSVALAAAIIAPERVTRLSLYGAWIFEQQKPSMFHWAQADGVGEALFALYYTERIDERMTRAFYDPTIISESFVERVEAGLEQPGTVAAALAAVRDQDLAALEPEYPQVAVPALLVWGREDRVSPLEYGERLARVLPGARLVVHPRCGHFPMIEAFEASTRDLDRFLAEGAAQ